MPFPFDVKEMEAKNFRDAGNGKTSRGVSVENKAENSVPVSTLGKIWDTLQVTFPSTNQDLFSYFYNNNLVVKILVTYENQSKKQIIEINKEVFDV